MSYQRIRGRLARKLSPKRDGEEVSGPHEGERKPLNRPKAAAGRGKGVERCSGDAEVYYKGGTSSGWRRSIVRRT